MMRHMNECAHRNKGASPPYALVLIKFFKYFDVDLENEASEDVIATLKGIAAKIINKKKNKTKIYVSGKRKSCSCQNPKLQRRRNSIS